MNARGRRGSRPHEIPGLRDFVAGDVRDLRGGVGVCVSAVGSRGGVAVAGVAIPGVVGGGVGREKLNLGKRKAEIMELRLLIGGVALMMSWSLFCAARQVQVHSRSPKTFSRRRGFNPSSPLSSGGIPLSGSRAGGDFSLLRLNPKLFTA